MLNIKKVLVIIMVFVLSTVMFGCYSVDDAEVKLGFKNKDFEYIKQGKIRKIIIQNTRDKSFRFDVTDQRAVNELYDILSSAKPVQSKSSLEPDYTFEMQESSKKIYKFNYVVGLDSKNSGNFYSNDKIYIVSKRVDNEIIKNFWDIRKPKDFEQVYYDSIINVLESYDKSIPQSNKIGIDIKDDINVSRFVLSTDLEDFKTNLNKKFSNTALMEDIPSYNILMGISTQGYKSNIYKCIVTFTNIKDNTEKKYYVWDKCDNSGKWNIQVYADKKPSGF